MQDVDTPNAWRNKYLLTGVAVNKAGKLDFTDSDQIFADIRNGEHNEYIYDMIEFD